jgi:hypothetical protein
MAATSTAAKGAVLSTAYLVNGSNECYRTVLAQTGVVAAACYVQTQHPHMYNMN